MKKLLFISFLFVALQALAQQPPPAEPAPLPQNAVVQIRHHFGSGIPGARVISKATHLSDGIYHVPQYMPFHPTAASIWPRVIDVECERDKEGGNVFTCDGYNWLPSMGRAEYLFIRPREKQRVEVAPQVIEKVVIVEVPGPERIILQEVPARKIRE